MLTNILKFLKGYLVIRLTGYAPERFLNLCRHHQITLWGLRSTGLEYEMCISIGGYKKLRPLVRKTRTKVIILERHGLPFLLHRYRNRKLFLVGALAGAALLYVMSLFVWNIHIDGNYSLSDQVVLRYLEELQVVHGMAKREVHGEEIEAKLREHFPEITWVSAEVKGTRLIVHIQESEHAAEELAEDTGQGLLSEGAIPEDEPADLVAADSGVIVSMIVRKGTPAVGEGMEVKKGDLLVASRVEVLDDSGEVASASYVHADADIRIQRREFYRESFPLQYEKKLYTGKTQTAVYVTIGRKKLAFGLPHQPFGQSDIISSEIPLKITENFYLPIVFGKNTRQEYKIADRIYSEKEAQEKAQQELLYFFEKLRIKGLQIMENDVKIEINGDVCTSSGSYLLEESAAAERAPEILLPENREETEEESETLGSRGTYF